MTTDRSDRDPDPRSQPVSTHYRGEQGQYYARTVQRNRAAEGLINKDKFAPFLRPDDVVLDFGCASGDLLLALAVAEKVGVEVNPATRAEAQAAGLQVYESLRSVSDQSVDVVISNHALEHVLSPYEVLVDLARVLRPTGRLIICVPADDWRNAAQWRPGDPNNHVYAWTPLTLGNLLTEARFTPLAVTMRHRAWPRGYVKLHRHLPRLLWDALCMVWAIGRRRREIMAIASAERIER